VFQPEHVLELAHTELVTVERLAHRLNMSEVLGSHLGLEKVVGVSDEAVI
jgi:hypothetical protein